MQNLKKIIPNLLTLSRILVTPLVIFLGIHEKIVPLIFVVIIIALTDFLDGKLARRWGVTSISGAKLDAIGDKILAICLLLILILKNKSFFYILVFEVLISLFNIYTFLKSGKVESHLIGKIKTWIIFSTIVIGLLNLLFSNLSILLYISVILTLLFQFLSLIKYIISYKDLRKSKKKTNF